MRTHKLTHLPSFSFGTLFSSTHLWVLLFLTACLLLFAAQEAEAATFNVTKTADTDDGTCDGDCSLREAIAAANGNGQADQINVPAGTYTLTTSVQLTVSSDMTISGAGESTTIIEAHVNPNTATWRVFNVTSNGTDVTFEDMTIRHGSTSSNGGGVYIELGIGSSGTATFTKVTITDNRTIGNIDGGGLYINDDITTVTLTECTISNNTTGDNGGGFHQTGAVNFNLTDCVISGNSATDGAGGRITESGSTNTFTRCTISGNMAGGGSNDDGAGLRIGPGIYTLTNCTITGNTNAGNGGGIYEDVGGNTIRLYNCTIANNMASGTGGGIHFSSGTNNMTNCIVADNTDGTGANDIHFLSGTLATNVTNLVENCTSVGACPTFSITTDPELGGSTTCFGGTVLQISAGSSAEDAGTSGGSAPSDDICKEARSNPPDLGSYEIVSPLPVELKCFRGDAIGDNTVRLEWATASEVNNDYFTIERSYDGADFDVIGELKAAGESHTPITYSYIDDQIDKGQFHIYYRLRQTDYEGNLTLSEIVTVSLEKDNGFDIASLFADSKNLSVTFHAPTDNEITASIFDLAGRLMSIETYQPTEGIYTLSLGIGPFTAGMYILHLNDGQRWVSEKFVKP